MATVNVDLGTVTVRVEAIAKPISDTRNAEPIQVDQLRPIRAVGVRLEDYRVRRGWPVEPPLIDVQNDSMVSVTGQMLADRPGAHEVALPATIRWIADPRYFDAVAGTWTAFQGAELGFLWRSAEDHQPTLVTDVPYYVEKELFLRDAINFDSDTAQHMYANIGAMAGSAGYSVVMACLLNSQFGNDAQREKIGLWCPGGAPEEVDEWAETETGFEGIIANGRLNINHSGLQGEDGVLISEAISASRVVYVGMVFAYPVSTAYISFGPSTIRHKSFYTGEPQETSTNVVLGRSTGSLLHTSDMAVFDLSVFGDALSFDDMRAHIAALSQSYGG